MHSDFEVSAEDLKRLIGPFHTEIQRGLAGIPSSIAMHPAFLARPFGNEQGRFVVVDLGGTNVRATVMDMRGDGSVRLLKSDGFRLPSTRGTSDDLFRPVVRFVGELLDEGVDYTLGFIFAFPMEQTGTRSGRLTKWTKEFDFNGVEGEDVVSVVGICHRPRVRIPSCPAQTESGGSGERHGKRAGRRSLARSAVRHGPHCCHGHEPGCSCTLTA